MRQRSLVAAKLREILSDGRPHRLGEFIEAVRPIYPPEEAYRKCTETITRYNQRYARRSTKTGNARYRIDLWDTERIIEKGIRLRVTQMLCWLGARAVDSDVFGNDRQYRRVP